MGKQNQYENNPEETEQLVRDQVKDLKEDGYDASEIADLLESSGYTEDDYRDIMESEGLSLPEWDEENDMVDAGTEAMWAEDVDDGGYNDDSYGEGGDY